MKRKELEELKKYNKKKKDIIISTLVFLFFLTLSFFWIINAQAAYTLRKSSGGSYSGHGSAAHVSGDNGGNKFCLKGGAFSNEGACDETTGSGKDAVTTHHGGVVFCTEPNRAADTNSDKYIKMEASAATKLHYNAIAVNGSCPITTCGTLGETTIGEGRRKVISLFAAYYHLKSTTDATRAAVQVLIWEVATGARTGTESAPSYTGSDSWYGQYVKDKDTAFSKAYANAISYAKNYNNTPSTANGKKHKLTWNGSSWTASISGDYSKFTCTTSSTGVSVTNNGSSGLSVTSTTYYDESNAAAINCKRDDDNASNGGEGLWYCRNKGTDKEPVCDPDYQKLVRGTTPAVKTDVNVWTEGVLVKIIKKDESDADLSGAEFTFSDGTRTYTIAGNNTDAVVVIPGTYSITETVVPTGYGKMADLSNIEIKAGTDYSGTVNGVSYSYSASTNTFTLTVKDLPLMLNWYKVAENGITRIEGAKFTITSPENTLLYHEADKVGIDTNSDGINDKSCYVIAASGSSEFVSDANGEVCALRVTGSSSHYTITETDPGAYHTFGGYKSIAQLASGAIRPISPEDINHKITTEGSDQTTKFWNLPTYFEFTKTATNSFPEYDNLVKEELKKIEFNVYDNSGNLLSFIPTTNGSGQTVYSSTLNGIDSPGGTPTSSLYIDDSKIIRIEHLPEGTYSIKEAVVNKCVLSNNCNCIGYYYPEYSTESDYKFTIGDCSNDSANACSSYGKATKSLLNEPTKITFSKEDFYSYYNSNDKVEFETASEVKEFDAITFKLKDENNNYISLRKISDGVYRYIKGESNNVVSELHTKNGQLTIYNLCRNNVYKIEEVAVPANSVFILPTPHPEKTYNITDKKTGAGNSVTAIIQNTPTKVEIWKMDSKTNELTEKNDTDPSVRFSLYKCNDNNCTDRTLINVQKELATFVDGSIAVDAYRYSKQNQATSSTTNSLTTNGGKIIIRYLPVGKYVIVETAAPDGYYLPLGTDAETKFEVSQATISSDAVKIKNDAVEIMFTKDDFDKYYTANDAATTGVSTKLFDTAKFVIQMRNDRNEWEDLVLKYIGKNEEEGFNEYRYLPVVSSSIPIEGPGDRVNDQLYLNTYKGKMKITHLFNNTTYRIVERETTDPANFILPEPNPYVVYSVKESKPVLGDESITQLMENVPTRVRFVKKDKSTDEIINNTAVRFELYKCNNSSCTSRERIYVTDREWINNNVQDSHYYNNTITNQENSLEYAYKYSKLNQVTNTEITTYHGEIIIRYLPAGKYVLVETAAPDGYYLPMEADANTIFEVSKTIVEQDINVIKNEVVEITFNKKDIYDYYTKDQIDRLDSDEKRIDQAKFRIKDTDGNILKLRFVEQNEQKGNVYRFLSADETSYPVSENGYLIPKYKDSNSNMIANDIDTINTYKGKLTITHLRNRTTYIIEEIEAPDNFILPEPHPEVIYNIHETKPLLDTDESITQLIENVPTRVRFEKRDSKYNYLIPDETTTFEVYRYDKDKECHPSIDKTNCELVHFNPREVIDGDNEDPRDVSNKSGVQVYKMIRPGDVKNGNMGITDLHPYHGILVLRYLSDDYNYVLLETVAPKNYTLPDGLNAETPFTVSGVTVDVNQIDVPNKPTSILIKKYNEDGTKLLPGAEFKIYERVDGKKCDPTVTAKNQNKTLVNLKTIRDGVYEARPIEDTSVVKTCTDKEGEPCNSISTNVFTKLTYTGTVNKFDGTPKLDGYTQTWADFDNESTWTKESDEKIELQEGEALIQYLEYGHCYIIEETKAPEGYSLPEDEEERFTMVTIDENDTYSHDTSKVLKNKPTSFQFYKFDEYNKLLDGAEFKLQKLNNDKKYEDVPVTRVEEKDDPENYYYKVDKTSEDTKILTHNGTATIYYLTEGQYRILEIKPAPGKELGKNPNVVTFFVDNKGVVYGNSMIINKEKTTKIEVKNSSKATLTVNIQTGQPLIKYGLIITGIVAIITSLILLKRKQLK